MKRFKLGLLDARKIVVRGRVTNLRYDEMEVTAEGPWGKLVFVVDARLVDVDNWPESNEEVEVVLR